MPLTVKNTALSLALIFCAATSQAAGNSFSINDLIHDVDLMKQLMKEAKPIYAAADAKMSMTDENAIEKAYAHIPKKYENANEAYLKILSQFEFKKPLSKCFGPNATFLKITTASTDHACVDAAGFKR